MKTVTSFGGYYELTFNPAGPEFSDGRLNPFSNPKIREAMNWLVDRDYIVQEIYGGLAVPKYLPITGAFPDYARYIDVVRELESKYAYNPSMANEVISKEMEAMGAVKDDDGKWRYKDEPVTLTFLIRNDGDGTRLPIGNYVANQLEDLGFTVDRQYKTSSEAAPIWLFSEPKEGQWHLYTGGWITTAVDRDQGGNFLFFYSPNSPYGFTPLWAAYQPSDEFESTAQALDRNKFATLDERAELFEKAMRLALEDSARVWLVDQQSFTPYRPEVEVTGDLAAGVQGAQLWPFTLRFVGQEGGDMRWAMSDLLVEPWNPVAGSNWVYDTAPIRATRDAGFMNDPFTGLAWPQRAERADVFIKKGLPVGKTLDWVNLEFVDEIQVPGDAWADWDATTQKFITVDELKTLIADAKVAQEEYEAKAEEAQAQLETKAKELAEALNYKALTTESINSLISELANMLNEVIGQEVDTEALFADEEYGAAVEELITTMNAEEPALAPEEQQKRVAEFVLSYVQVDDFASVDPVAAQYATRPEPGTALRKSVVYYPENFWDTVKWHDGSAITPADIVMSLIMTFDPGKPDSAIYDESQAGNLEVFLSTFKGMKITSWNPFVAEFYTDSYSMDAELNVTSFWPAYSQGDAKWDVIAVGNLAEANNELAWSADKAEANEVEWASLVGGPSLEVLDKYLGEALGNAYIPYEPTLGEYITSEDAVTRYQNLGDFYMQHGHFWVGTGPYILDQVFTTEKTITLVHNPDYPDKADKWSQFSEPMIAEVEIDGANVMIGSEASFDVFVTFNDDAYPADDISSVKYLVFGPDGSLVVSGDADGVTDGQYSIKLAADQTAQLTEGANTLEVVVVSKLVSIPTIVDFEFVATK